MNPQPKPKTFRSRKHLDFVKKHRCLACELFVQMFIGQTSFMGTIDPSHESFGNDKGTGKKSSDLYAVPLCRYHHEIREKMGTINFWGDKLPDMLIFTIKMVRESFPKADIAPILIEALRNINNLMCEGKK